MCRFSFPYRTLIRGSEDSHDLRLSKVSAFDELSSHLLWLLPASLLALGGGQGAIVSHRLGRDST